MTLVTPRDDGGPLDSSSGAIILAAGRGVRFNSALPKALHPVGGSPMVRRVVQAVRSAGIGPIVAVTGPDPESLRQALPQDVRFVVQPTPLGTADAARVGLSALDPAVRRVLVVGADTPLVSSGTLRQILGCLDEAVAALATTEVDDPTGYGRVIVGSSGQVERIVEEADASPQERAVRLVSGMVFAFDRVWMANAVENVEPAASGEFYLTHLVESAAANGQAVRALRVLDPWEIAGVNTRRQLAEVERRARERVRERLLEAGVTLVDLTSVYVDESVVVGKDVTIHPHCYLRGETTIGDGCVLGPGAEVIDSQLGAGARVWWSVVEGAQVGEGVHIGPYSRVRPGTTLSRGVMLGSFAEVKNSVVGEETQVHHFSYLGDAEVGPRVNIGAGTVTCNFDGVEKHRTMIGAGAFIGSDTMLVAPVTVGEGAVTGAGAVVTHDVPPGACVVGVPARPLLSSRQRQRNAKGERT